MLIYENGIFLILKGRYFKHTSKRGLWAESCRNLLFTDKAFIFIESHLFYFLCDVSCQSTKSHQHYSPFSPPHHCSQLSLLWFPCSLCLTLDYNSGQSVVSCFCYAPFFLSPLFLFSARFQCLCLLKKSFE